MPAQTNKRSLDQGLVYELLCFALLILLYLALPGLAMGKWWKCRFCQASNHKSSYYCSWCGSQFQDLFANPSSPQDPAHSFDNVRHVHAAYGKGGYAKGGPVRPSGPMKAMPKSPSQQSLKGTGQAAGQVSGQASGHVQRGKKETFFSRRAKERSATKVNAPIPAPSTEAPVEDTMEQDQEEALKVREELDVVNTMIASLKGSTSAVSVAKRQGLQLQATNLQHELTKHKSLEAQLSILQACQTRREKQVTQKQADLSAAQVAADAAQSALAEAQLEVSRVQALLEARKLTQEAMPPQPVSDMVSLARRMLPATHLDGFLECISLMRQAAKEAAEIPVHEAKEDPYNGGHATVCSMTVPPLLSGPKFFGTTGAADFGDVMPLPATPSARAPRTPLTPAARGRQGVRSSSPSANSASVRSRSKGVRASTSGSPLDHFSRRERVPIGLP